jgi:hypothetical protein
MNTVVRKQFELSNSVRTYTVNCKRCKLMKRPIKNSILRYYSSEVKIFKNKPDPARGPPVGIAGLDNVGSLISHNPIGFHGLLRG